MRASRLLHLLLLLQTRRRMTTTELAERLEVSRRTVLRDVEALSAAGVPVYTERGRHGGVALLPGARIDTARLDPPELEALSVTGLDELLLAPRGLTAVHETATRKIAAHHAGMPGVGTRARLCRTSSWSRARHGWRTSARRSTSQSSPRPCGTAAGYGSGTGAAPRREPRPWWSTRTGWW